MSVAVDQIISCSTVGDTKSRALNELHEIICLLFLIRLHTRFDKMIEDGGIEEVKQLLEKKYDPNLSIMKAIGVREISKYLSNELTLQEASDLAKQKTRNYIKRQITWTKGNNITQNCNIEKYL